MKTKEQMYEEINALKQVNLIDFACSVYGYQVDLERTEKENANKDNPKYVFITNDAGDKILISRVQENGHQIYLYKNLFNDLDSGNILSFIKYRNRENYSIPYVKKTIKNFTDNLAKGYYKQTGYSISISAGESDYHSESKMEQVRLAYQKMPDFVHPEYLISRGLSKDLLYCYLLEKRIKNEYIYGLKVSASRKPPVKHINTIFPIYTLENDKTLLCGYVRKNKDLKITGENSAQSIGIWLSNYKHDQPLTHLVITESPIDSISYCQMKINLETSNPLLLASNGEVTKTQLELYQEIATRLRPEAIILGNDNNCRGQLFNAKILSAIQLPDKFVDKEFYSANKLIVDAHVHCGYKDQHRGEITWKFNHSKIEDNLSKEDYVMEHIPQFQKVVEYYGNLNHEKYLQHDESHCYTIDKRFTEFHSEINISFDNSKVNWIGINESLRQLKFNNSEHIKIEVASNDDFNDDLKASMKITPEPAAVKHSLG